MRFDSELMSLVSTPSFARARSIADCFSVMLDWMACNDAERDASGSSATSASAASINAAPSAAACRGVRGSIVHVRPLTEAG